MQYAITTMNNAITRRNFISNTVSYISTFIMVRESCAQDSRNPIGLSITSLNSATPGQALKVRTTWLNNSITKLNVVDNIGLWFYDVRFDIVTGGIVLQSTLTGISNRLYPLYGHEKLSQPIVLNPGDCIAIEDVFPSPRWTKDTWNAIQGDAILKLTVKSRIPSDKDGVSRDVEADCNVPVIALQNKDLMAFTRLKNTGEHFQNIISSAEVNLFDDFKFRSGATDLRLVYDIVKGTSYEPFVTFALARELMGGRELLRPNGVSEAVKLLSGIPLDNFVYAAEVLVYLASTYDRLGKKEEMREIENRLDRDYPFSGSRFYDVIARRLKPMRTDSPIEGPELTAARKLFEEERQRRVIRAK